MSDATILTHSGLYFDLLDPTPEMIRIADIAQGLSQCCRFVGQTPYFYSVAEHCVMASMFCDPAFAFEVLMHDAAEAYLGDVSRPLKKLLSDYREIEARVEKAIAQTFGLRPEAHDEIKRIDAQMLGAEQWILFRNRDAWDGVQVGDPAPMTDGLGWTPDVARRVFLARFHGLRR